MGRKRQLGVALDDDLREQLEKLASEADRSIADEIRQRLERTLKQDALPGLAAAAEAHKRTYDQEILNRVCITLVDEHLHDRETRQLGHELMALAQHVLRHTKCAWHAHPKAHEAFTEAVRTWLEESTPVGVGEGEWGQDDPKTLGRAIARMVRIHEEKSPKILYLVEEGEFTVPDYKKTLTAVKKATTEEANRKGKKKP